MERTYYPNGQIKEEMWNRVNNITEPTYHNDNGPAYQSWFINGQRKSVMYQVHNEFHNDNGPAYQSWHFNPMFHIDCKSWEDDLCIPKKIAYYHHGKCDRNDGPAIQVRYKSGQLRKEQYWVNGLQHREIKPAIQEWYDNGQINKKLYYRHGVGHRNNKPSRQIWHPNGQIHIEEYWNNDHLHNEDGPAVRKWDLNGNLIQMSNMVNGRCRIDTKEPAVQKWVNGLRELCSWRLDEHSYKVEHYENGIKIDTIYRYDYKSHRKDGPAMLKYYPSGKIKEHRYYIHDKLHNEDGPAILKWDEEGNVIGQLWYYNGIKQDSIITKRAL